MTTKEDEGNKITIRVEQICKRPDRMSLILAYFSTSYDPSKVDPETGEKYKTPKVTVYKHKDDKHKDQSKQRVQVVISPPGAKVEFVGTNYSSEQAASPTTGYALGILNRETKRMRILPVAYNKIIRLEPNVKSQEIEASGSEQVTKASGTNLLFGTKASINQDKKKRALNLGDDLQTQKFLEEKFNKLDINASARTSTSSSVARNIPPHDVSATTASEAYPLEKIIQKREWNFLKDIYQLLQQESGAAGNSFNAYPVFVRNRLYRLRDIEDDTEKQTTSAALSLLAHLVYFKELNSGASKNLAKSHEFPKIIHQKCKSLFCDPESEGISAEKTNLLISYVLVLTLHVDKFKMDPEDITNDLRMRTGGLRKHYEQLGCKFVREKSSLVATLPVPLSSSLLRVCRRGRNDRWRETKGVMMILKKICYILPVLENFFGLMTHKTSSVSQCSSPLILFLPIFFFSFTFCLSVLKSQCCENVEG